MKKKTLTQYEALGFVEALIAIMVSGIVATVLINIAASAMKELVRLDVEDAQAHHARSTAVIVQNIANRERVQDEEYHVFTDLEENYCYRLEGDGSEYRFATVAEDTPTLVSYTISQREAYKKEAAISQDLDELDSDFFRIVCIEDNTRSDGDPTNDTNKVFVKIIIGFNKVSGIYTTSTDFADYKYYALINL